MSLFTLYLKESTLGFKFFGSQIKKLYVYNS